VRASVVVVVHAGAHHFEDSLGSLASQAERGLIEVVLVDNGSADRCGEEARRRYPWAIVVRSEDNTGFAGGVHLGVRAATGDVLVLLNDDAAAEPDLVEAHLETLATNPKAAVSAGRLTTWDGRRHDFVRGGVTFDCHAFQLGQGFEVADIVPPAPGTPLPFACGGNMAIRRSDWERSGGFDSAGVCGRWGARWWPHPMRWPAIEELPRRPPSATSAAECSSSATPCARSLPAPTTIAGRPSGLVCWPPFSTG